jgi:hypothetical protein
MVDLCETPRIRIMQNRIQPNLLKPQISSLIDIAL